MRRPLIAVAIVLALVLIIVAIALVYNRRPSAPPPARPSAAGSTETGGSAAARARGGRGIAQWGATGRPSQNPQGLRITGFLPSPGPSPLEVIGVREGDVIVRCNGASEQLRDHLLAAMTGLQERGEPIVLVVSRDGRLLTLERTEKLPSAGRGTGQH